MDQEKAKLRTDLVALTRQLGETTAAAAALSARVQILEAAAEAAKAAKSTFFAKREKK